MLLLACLLAFADSPLTSTDLSVGYPQSEGVRLARTGLTDAVVAFLLGDHPLGERIAVIDALGWQGEGRAETLVAAIAKRRGKSGPADLQLRDLLPAERVLLGYLLAHDHYGDLAPMKPGQSDALYGGSPLALATSGANALPKDFAAHAVVALIDAQSKMSEPWCAIWTTWAGLLERFPADRRNLPPASVAEATAYLKLYEESCGPVPGEAPSPELNQVYALAPYNGMLVAGAQGGVVVWKDGKVEDFREEKICSSLAVYGGALYAGCYHRLLRYDGGWTTLSFDSEVREGGSFDVFLDAGGDLLVRQGKRAHRVVGGKLVAAGAIDDGYDLAWDPDGTVWSIDFLTAIVHGGRRYPVGSGTYPGKDPRHFGRDARGQLWVSDFESGFFVYDPDQDRFVGVPGVENKGSDVAVDGDRGRIWMLHYTEGLVLNQRDELYRLDLSELEYMRVLHLAPDGVVYVGGWNGIARVGRENGAFVVTKLAL